MKTLLALLVFGSISAFAQNHDSLNNRSAYPAPCEELVTCFNDTCYAKIYLWSYDQNGLPIKTRIEARTVVTSDKQSENRAAALKYAIKRLEQLKNLGVCR